MKKLLCILSLLLLSCGKKDEVSFFRPSKPQMATVHGMTLFMLPDSRLPVFHTTLYIRGGAVLDPVGQEGLSGVAMEAIRLGGTRPNGTNQKPEQIEEWIESVGGHMEFGTSPEYMTASLSILAKDTEQGLTTFFDLIRKPAVDSAQFEIFKRRAIDRLRRESEDPLRYAMKEFPPLVYGKGSLWGRRERITSLQTIQREDVLRFHQRFFHPNRMVLAVSGDFDPKDLVKRITELTQDWPPVQEALPEVSKLDKKFEPHWFLIPQPGLTQTTLVMGHFGETRDNPDKYPLLVMNFILGGSGSLVSRLGEEIRSVSGKAYAVWSLFSFNRDYGVFQGIAQTASPNAAWVVDKMKEMITQMATNPKITEEELNRAKASILRSFIFTYETKQALVNDLAKFYLWGYPADYLEEFQKAIAKVTVQDIERVAKRYLNPEGMKVLLVGDPDKIKEQFKQKMEILQPN